MDQNDNIMRFLVMPFDILGIKELNMTDKFVFARIAGFKKFYESSQSTADFLGLSKIQVERAKRKLVKLGYVIELADTGRGKVYRCQDFYCIAGKIDSECQGRYDKNVRPDITKMSYQTTLKCQTENKYRIKKEIKGDENIAKPVEKSGYGRADLNELVALWEKETGINIEGQANQRRQLYNLVKKYGLDGTKTLVKRVGVAIHSPDRFAPQIATPSDLTGKYSKLPKLELWENRAKFAKSFGSPAPKMATASLTRGIPEYNGAWDEQTDEERAEVSAMMQEFRSRLGAK